MRRGAILLLAALAAGCGDRGGEGLARRTPVPAPVRANTPAVEVVRHTFYPRPVSEDFWEVVPLAEVGPWFVLLIHPRIETPAEGPWNVTFRDPAGKVLAVHEGLWVDTATGAFTFLCDASRFSPGDWSISLVVPEGGMVGGPREREYRFRVE